MPAVDREAPEHAARSEHGEQLVPEALRLGQMLEHHDGVGDVDRTRCERCVLEQAGVHLGEAGEGMDRGVGLDADERAGDACQRFLERHIAVKAVAAADIEKRQALAFGSDIVENHVAKDAVPPFALAIALEVGGRIHCTIRSQAAFDM